MHCNQLNNFSFCVPEKRIADIERMTKHLTRERSHLCENKWMSRACGASANDLRRNRQVKAYDTVLEEADSIPAKHFSHNAPESKEQERSRPLRILRVMQRPGHCNFD